MALDLETKLADQLGIECEAHTRRLVARLLLQVVHDVNGRLGTAILRASSVARGLERAEGALTEGDVASGTSRLLRAGESHVALREALTDLKTLLAGLSEAAWELEEGAEVR